MAFHKMLSVCVLIAGLANGECVFSNLMDAPLKLAVSLLDGPAFGRTRPHHTTTEPTVETKTYTTHIPGPTVTATPGSRNTKVAAISMARRVPVVQAIQYDSGTENSNTESSTAFSRSDSGEVINPSAKENRWYLTREASKRVVAVPSKSHSMKSSYSKGRVVYAIPGGAGHKARHSSWKKSGWMDRTGGSSEESVYKEVHVVSNRPAKSDSGSSEEFINIVVPKTAKASKRANRYNNRAYGYRGGVKAEVAHSSGPRPHGHCHWCHH